MRRPRAGRPHRSRSRVLQSLRGYFLGVTIVAAFNAVVVGGGALVLGVPLVGTIALITFLGAYIPYLGAWGAGAFAVLIALGGAGTDAAVGMIIIQLLANGLLQQLVQPIAYGAALGIHPLAVLVVTIAGGALFGAAGLILAAPIVSAVNRITADLRGRARGRGSRRPSTGRGRRPGAGELSDRSWPRTAHEEVGVLGVDDQPFFLDVVREVVAATAGFRWLGGASSGEDALGAVDELHPALVLLDVRMPDMDGLATARRIRDRHPDVVVVLVSVELSAATPRAVEASGAAVLVRKQEFGPAALRRLWRAYAGSAGKPAADPGPGCRELTTTSNRPPERGDAIAHVVEPAPLVVSTSKPGPSSRTSKRRSLPSSSTTQIRVEPGACFATFCIASRQQKYTAPRPRRGSGRTRSP